jgi:hypothetical protein
MISASHPRADICALLNTPKRMAATILQVGAIRDHPAAYLRRAFRSLVLPTTASDLVQTMTMITFRAKAARSHFALAPIRAAPTLGRQLKARMSVCDYTLHLLAGQGSPYLQYDRQRNDQVPVGIVPGDSLDWLGPQLP